MIYGVLKSSEIRGCLTKSFNKNIVIPIRYYREHENGRLARNYTVGKQKLYLIFDKCLFNCETLRLHNYLIIIGDYKF